MSGRLGAQVFFAGGALDPVSFRGSVDSVGFTALWVLSAAALSGCCRV